MVFIACPICEPRIKAFIYLVCCACLEHKGNTCECEDPLYMELTGLCANVENCKDKKPVCHVCGGAGVVERDGKLQTCVWC